MTPAKSGMKTRRTFIVAKDAAQAEGEHPEEDLRLIPFKCRVSYSSYYKIVRAHKQGTKRVLDIQLYTKTGGRIRTS